MRDKINFQPNETHTLTIAGEPTETTGQWGTQMRYFFDGDQIAWLDANAHDAILQALDLREGERFTGHTITLAKTTARSPNNRQTVAWHCQRVNNNQTRYNQPAPQTRYNQPAPAPQATTSQARTQTPPQNRGEARRMTNEEATALGFEPEPATHSVTRLVRDPRIAKTARLALEAMAASCLCWREISRSAETEGIKLNYNAGDIRSLAATILIHATEDQTAKKAA
jgi:hypothetical protein